MIIWDVREKVSTIIEKFKYQITSVAFNQNSEQVFIGGIDNTIKIYNLKKRQIENILIGHTDTVTGMALSNDGNYLLSNSMDNSIKCWDIRPFVQGSRCIKEFTGHSHNFEKNLLKVCWSPNDNLISAGSADRYVYIWNFETCNIERKLGGHNGSVNETSFNKLSKIIASCSSDHTSIIGEINIL
jgi:Prp8 binding protein